MPVIPLSRLGLASLVLGALLIGFSPIFVRLSEPVSPLQAAGSAVVLAGVLLAKRYSG